MLSVTSGKKCCVIKSMSSIIEFIRLLSLHPYLLSISKLRIEDIERVTKRERAICRPECFKRYLILKELKHVYFCCLNFHF